MTQPEAQPLYLFNVDKPPTGRNFKNIKSDRLLGYVGLKFTVTSEERLVYAYTEHDDKVVPLKKVTAIRVPAADVVAGLREVGHDAEAKHWETKLNLNQKNVVPLLEFSIEDGVLEPASQAA